MANYERTDGGARIYYECLPSYGNAEGPCGHQHTSLGTAEECLYRIIAEDYVSQHPLDIKECGYNAMGWCIVEKHVGSEYSWERMWGTDANGDTRRIQDEPHPGWTLWRGPGRRIGPKMAEVVSFVEAHPGTLKIRAAQYVGPHGSLQYGYATVDRALAAGLVLLSDCRSVDCRTASSNHCHLVPSDVI